MRTIILAITLLMLGSPILQTAAASPDGVSALAGTRCELVEVYPGYPGYEGYVTGVDGIGDHACLEDLERQNRSFDRVDEDRKNLDAARALGINGGPDLWTWENRMAIEAERGMTPACYTCRFDLNGLRSQPSQHTVDSDDPRLMIGLPYNSSPNQLDFLFGLRIRVSLANAGEHINAKELLSGMRDATSTGSSSLQVGSQSGWCDALNQGGYAPTPAQAASSDQLFLLEATFYVVYLPRLSSFYAQADVNSFGGISEEWELNQAQSRSAGTFADVVAQTRLGDGC